MKLFDFLSWLLIAFLFDLLNPKVTTGEHYLPHLCICLRAFQPVCVQLRCQNVTYTKRGGGVKS